MPDDGGRGKGVQQGAAERVPLPRAFPGPLITEGALQYPAEACLPVPARPAGPGSLVEGRALDVGALGRWTALAVCVTPRCRGVGL